MRWISYGWVLLVMLFAVSAVGAAIDTVVFQDDFSGATLDQNKWSESSLKKITSSYQRRNYFPDPAWESDPGYSIGVSGGAVRIDNSSTDNGGRLVSEPIAVNGSGLLTVSARIYVHNTTSNYFSGLSRIWSNDTRSTLSLWSHHDYDYGTSHHHGFGWANVGVAVETAALWDQWVTETVTYDPVTGLTTYAVVDGLGTAHGPISRQFVPAPPELSEIILDYDSYGWFTGQYLRIDSITVTQGNALPVQSVPTAAALPAGLLLIGSLLIHRRR